MNSYVAQERVRYQMRQRLFAIGEDYDIKDEQGHAAFHVDGKVLRIRETFVIQDMQGNEVVTVKQKLLALRETMTVERGGELLASVHKAFFHLLRDRFVIDVHGGEDMTAMGGFLEHNYTIQRGGHTVATIAKKWFTFRDTYGIEIEPGEDIGLILGIAVVIDEVAQDKDEKDHDESSDKKG